MRTRAQQRHRWTPAGRYASALALVAAAGSAALAQPQGGNGGGRGQGGDGGGEAPVVVLERSALGDFVVDERDAALARAIGMIPARLRELPGEIDGFDELPPPVVDLVLTALSRPARLALTYNAHDQTRGAFGIGLVASLLTTGKNQSNEIHGTVSGLIAAGRAPFESKPSQEYAGMMEMFLPVGQLRYGPREVAGAGGGKGRTTWELHFGSVSDPDAAFAALPSGMPAGLPQGFTPVIRGRIDPAPLTPLVNMGRMMAAGTPGIDAIDSAIKSGVVGPEAVKYSFQFGYTDDASLSVWVLEGVKRYASKWGLGTEPLSEAQINTVPADATVAAVTSFDPGVLWTMLADLKEQEPRVGEGLAEFAAQTGVDLERDVLAALGGTVGLYFADSTGGAGLTSGVLLLSLKEPARLREASAKLSSMANAVMAQHHDIKGHIRMREWRQDGVSFSTLSFPGVPVPLELTYSITDGHLVAALTPQAAIVGVRQATGKGGKGLMSNAAFRDGLVPGKRPTAVSFIDTERVMSDGYPFVVLMGSALANAVRSPMGADREPGIIVPPLGDLREGVRPRVGCTYWEGDNLVKVTRGNRSLVVEACGVMGAAAPVLPVLGGVMGGMANVFEERHHRHRFHDVNRWPDEMDHNEMDDEEMWVE